MNVNDVLSITIAGVINGNIMATEKLIIIAPARINGDIQAPSVSLGEGAIVNGMLRMVTAQDAVERLLTLAEVAEYLEVENSVLIEWAKSNKIPAKCENNEWQFKKEEVDSWVQKERVQV